MTPQGSNYKIFIESINLKNFMTFKKFKVDNLGFYNTIIIAGNNGSGKSTISSEAVFYNLFGAPLRTNKISSIISKGENSGLVEIGYLFKFKNSQNEFLLLKISRTLKEKKNKVNLDYMVIDKNYNIVDNIKNRDILAIIDVIDKYKSKRVNELNNLIQSIFKINKEDFTTINLRSPFSQSPTSSFNDIVLKEILSVDKIRDFNSYLKSQITSKLKEKEFYLNELNRLLSLKEKIAKKDTLKEKINEYKKEYLKIKEEKEKLEGQIKIKEEKYLKIKEKFNQIKSKYNDLILMEKTLGAEISKYESKYTLLKNEYSKHKRLINKGKCPVCKQDITANTFSSTLNHLKTEGKEIMELIKEKRMELEKLEKEKENLEELYKKYELEYRNAYEEYIDKKNEFSYYKKKLNDIKSMASAVKNQINSLNIEVDEKVNELKNEIKNINIQIDKYKELEKIFNLKSQYVKSYIKISMNKFKKILNEVVIVLSRGKFTSIDITISRAGENLIINDEILYSNLSTSEKKIIDLSISIAIVLYSLSFNNFPFILDEFFDNFDIENIEFLLEELITLFSKIDTQIVITTNYFDSLITKNNSFKLIDLRA